MSAQFELASKFQPAGDQPQAIEKLVAGFSEGKSCQVLLGATGTGKTFTASNVIAKLNKPTLVLSHNKTLAAQLYKEFKGFFPRNAVHYFVSYYDYYQPEAYIPQRDIYIEKDALINENIDRLRLAATSALVSREDVLIVASVSCIYGLGSPSDYKAMMVRVVKGEIVDRDSMLLKLVDIQYQRNDVGFRARQVPRPRRRGRGLAGIRGIRLSHRAVRRRGREPGHHQPRQRRDAQAARRTLHLPGQAFRDARRAHSSRPWTGFAASWKHGWPSCASRANCWKPSGSALAPASTWKCCWRSAIAPASRITRAGSPAAKPASRLTRCSTFSPKIS